jgi:citrate lyase gamma subunit
MTCWRFCKILILSLEPLFMSSAQAGGYVPDPLQGPDFVLEKVASWKEAPPGGDAELILRDGSSWKLKPGTKLYETQRSVIARAVRRDSELFVSGDQRRGAVDLVVNARSLAAEQVASKEENGRYTVVFQGPPSAYYLRTDRPWFAQALALLRRSASGGGSFSSPDLVVAIDPGEMEIMAVRPLNSPKPKPGSPR